MVEHWPGQQAIDKDGKEKASSIWKWPHLDYGSIGSATLISKDGRVRWSTVVDTAHNRQWVSLSEPTKVFPETRPPQIDIYEHSTRQRAEKGLQYLRTCFPDADFPDQLLGHTLHGEAKEMRALKAFDPFLGNVLETFPSHQVENESVVVFPMGELGSELNVSRFSPDGSENPVFNPTGSPSHVFETPILQVTSAVGPARWTSTPSSLLLVRTHSASSLLRLHRSKVTRELDITRSETGDIPIVDSRILASGPDIVVVNRNGEVYKCSSCRGGKTMQSIGAHEADDDLFWQLGVTGRGDECFLTSRKSVKHIDFRSGNSITGVFSLDHPSTVVTSFESPVYDYISRITTTSDVIWLDDRFRRQPLLSYKHHRSFDRTLRLLTAHTSGATVSLLTSRRNGLVTLYDVGKGRDGLFHCNARPSCLPHVQPIVTAYKGHALVSFSPNTELTFLRLCQRGSIYRQDFRFSQPGKDQPGPMVVTHHWDDSILALEERANGLQIDFGPAGGKHFTQVNLRGAYEKMFAFRGDEPDDVDRNAPGDMLARLPDSWRESEGIFQNMLTSFDVISNVVGDKYPPHRSFLEKDNINSKQIFSALILDHPAIQELVGLARWHYNIRDTSIPSCDNLADTCAALCEHLKELDLVSEAERQSVSVRREAEAREQLAVDLVLSRNVYSARPFVESPSFTAREGASNANTGMSYNDEPPEVNFGYFRPVRKEGADHYADKQQDAGISSPLGIRLLLAEWKIGADPNDYTYCDPYGLADQDTRPVLHYRKPFTAPQTTQKKQIQPQCLPLVTTVATHPQVIHAVERPAGSQATSGIEVFSQEPMMNTQVLPGPFGGRPGAGGRKGGKKRIGGF